MDNDKKFMEDSVIKFPGLDEDAWSVWKRVTEEEIEHPYGRHTDDMVNSPSHYTQGRFEAIDVIEDAIQEAPSVKLGFLQGQVLKYLLRLWHKIDCKEDAEKARWYLNRLIDSLD